MTGMSGLCGGYVSDIDVGEIPKYRQTGASHHNTGGRDMSECKHEYFCIYRHPTSNLRCKLCEKEITHEDYQTYNQVESLRAQLQQANEEIELLQKVANEDQAEIERLREDNASICFERNLAQIQVHELQSKLSRYEQGVEVGGMCYAERGIIAVYSHTPLPMELDVKRVRVIMLKEEV